MQGREEFRRRAEELMLAHQRTASDTDDMRALLRRQSGPWFNFIERVWPALSAEQLLHELYTVELRRQHGAQGVLSETEADLLARPGTKRVGDQRWTRADAVLIDEAQFLLRGRGDGWHYVIVDEAQDLTPMQLRMVGRRSLTGDLTLVGDLAQATGPHRYRDWHEIVGHIGSKKPASIEELARGYRVPNEMLNYASMLLPAIAPGLAATTGLRSAEGFWVTLTDDAPASAAGDVANTLDEETGTIGVIAAGSMVRAIRDELDEAGVEYGVGKQAMTTRVSVLAAVDAKGLEFDHVIVVEPAAIVAEGPQGLAELYVALTRPTRSLSVWHDDPLPANLR
jgi:DNA helicase IV